MVEEESKGLTFAPQLLRDVFGVGTSCPGCGEQIGLKISLQVLGKCVLVNSDGSMALLAKYPKTSFNVPYVNCGLNAAATASALSRYSSNVILVYAGDAATLMHLDSLIAAAYHGDNFIYVCYNNKGFGSVDHSYRQEKSIASSIALHAVYTATASIAYPEDFVTKLRKAAALQGVKFIEILTPCPATWKFDPSITIEVARLAVESGVWPLYEVENKKVVLTKRPSRLEPIDRYLSLQKRFSFTDEEKNVIQETAKRNYKLLSEGKLA